MIKVKISIIIFFSFFLITPSFAQNKVSFGISSEYSANYMKTALQVFEKYETFNNWSISANILYEPFKNNTFAIKSGLYFRRYNMIVDVDYDEMEDVEFSGDGISGWTKGDIFYKLNYVGLDIRLLFHGHSPKYGFSINYALERQMSQTNNYVDEGVEWYFYKPYHHSIGGSFYFFPIPKLSLNLDLKGSVSPFGLSYPNDNPKYRDKFLVYGAGLSVSYYFNRKKKAKNQE